MESVFLLKGVCIRLSITMQNIIYFQKKGNCTYFVYFYDTLISASCNFN